MKLLDEVLKEFDFEKVDSVMRYLGWKWVAWGCKMVIPGIYGLMKVAQELLEEVLKYDDGIYHDILSGGLKASFDGTTLGLEFVISSFETPLAEEDDAECTD